MQCARKDYSGRRFGGSGMRGAGWFVVAVATMACSNESSVRRVSVPPDAAITWPADGEIIRQGVYEEVLFTGEAGDSYTPFSDLTLMWTLDGISFDGEASLDEVVSWEVPEEGMTLGEHLLSLTVEDSDGAQAVAAVAYVVAGPWGSPDVQITRPEEDGLPFALGSEVHFQGEATDLTTDPRDLVHVWSSDRDGVFKGVLVGEDGVSAVFKSDLSVGEHLVTLEVTDEDGEVGTDSITVVMVEEPTGTTPPGDTGEPPTMPEPGDLVVSEMMINPDVVEDELGEWVELYNTGGWDVDLYGYSIHDDDFDRYVFDTALIIPGYGYVVLCANMDSNLNGGVPCDGVFRREAVGALALGNEADEVILSRPDGVAIDEIHYEPHWFRSRVALGLDPAYLDDAPNNDLSRWCDQVTVMTTGGEAGTPGVENDPCE